MKCLWLKCKCETGKTRKQGRLTRDKSVSEEKETLTKTPHKQSALKMREKRDYIIIG